MQCEEVRRIADLYLDNLLDEETTDSLQRHLFVCPACSHEIETVRATILLLQSQVTAERPTPSFKERTTAILLDRLSDYLHTTEPALSVIQWPLPIE